MTLKRKRSTSELCSSPLSSSASSTSSSPPHSSSLAMFGLGSMSGPAHRNSRTLKRFRSSRPAEQLVHRMYPTTTPRRIVSGSANRINRQSALSASSTPLSSAPQRSSRSSTRRSISTPSRQRTRQAAPRHNNPSTASGTSTPHPGHPPPRLTSQCIIHRRTARTAVGT